MQLRFKQLPKGPLFLGLEGTSFQQVSRFMRQAEALTVAAASKVVGPLYKSPGDNPAQMGDAEAEPPCTASPLYVCDQLIVSDAGQEPDITSDLNGLGWLRVDGFAAHRRRVEESLGSPVTDKVYTVCLWSISQIVDTIHWTTGIPGFPRVGSEKLGWAPPNIGVLYELADPEGSEHDAKKETRHLISRKNYYARFAFWSTLKPPAEQHLRKVLQLRDEVEQERPSKDASSTSCFAWLGDWANLACCTGPRD